jgi:hypothetical protein
VFFLNEEHRAGKAPSKASLSTHGSIVGRRYFECFEKNATGLLAGAEYDARILSADVDRYGDSCD